MLDVLVEKGPLEADLSYLFGSDHAKFLPCQHTRFDELNASIVRKFITEMQGIHGPFGIDAKEWASFWQPNGVFDKSLQIY